MADAYLHRILAESLDNRLEALRHNRHEPTGADLADAVLDTLRLNYETRPGIMRASGRFVTGPVEIRYVTEWAAHD